jgi:uncharacterized protein YjbJ (UPF0337 family)
MSDPDDEPADAVPESPSTWENVVAGEIKKVVGHLIGDDQMAQEGDEQVDIAHEAREEFREEHEK